MPCAPRSLALLLFASAQPTQAEADAQPFSLPAEAQLAKALNAFAADLYRTLVQSGAPTCSPTSASAALLTALLGADGTTADQLARTLHLPADLRGPALRDASRKLLEDAHLLREPQVVGPRLTTACWTEGGSPAASSAASIVRNVGSSTTVSAVC